MEEVVFIRGSRSGRVSVLAGSLVVSAAVGAKRTEDRVTRHQPARGVV